MQYQNFDVLRHDLYQGLSLVEASAGTGKTYSITWIVVRLLINGIKINEILLTTFTVEATKELKERITHLLRQLSDLWLDEALWTDEIRTIYTQIYLEKHRINRSDLTINIPYDTQVHFWTNALDRLNEALLMIDEGLITTIHGFCSKMLKDHSLEAGFEFPKIEMDLSSMFREITDDYQSYLFSEGHPLALNLLKERENENENKSIYSKKKKPFLLSVIEKLQETIWEDIWFDRMDETLACFLPNGPQAKHDHPKDVICFWQQLMQDLVDQFQQSFSVFQNEKEMDDLQAYIEMLYQNLKFSVKDPKAKRSKAMEQLRLIFKEPLLDHKIKLFFSYAPNLKTLTTQDLLSNLYKSDAKKFKSYVQNPVIQALDHCISLKEKYQSNLVIYYKKCFVNYAKNALNQRKKQRNIIGISDLIFLTYEAISKKDQVFLNAVKSQFKAVLIDEFQDTDPMQWGIFGKIVQNSEIITYLIGDPKQSIYRFRGADLNAYLLVKDDVKPHRCFTMSKNFRSDPQILKTLNYLFDPEQKGASAGSSSLGEGFFRNSKIPYIHVEAGKKDRYSSKAVKFIHLQNEKALSFKRYPDYIAGEVKKYLEENHSIGDPQTPEQQRPVKKSDIGILVRSNYTASDISNALSKRGIPSTLLTTESVFKTKTAKCLELILRAILMPSDASAIKSAISSELFNLSASDVKNNWDSYKPTLIKLHEMWMSQGVAVALNALLIDEKINLIRIILAQSNGPQTLTNYMHLIELLQTYAVNDHLTPELTLNWLRDKRLEEIGDEGTNLAQEQIRPYLEEDAVQILTIHKSKGLEYPILFCVDVSYISTQTKEDKKPKEIKEVDPLVKGSKKILDLRSQRDLLSTYPLSIVQVETQAYQADEQENRRLLYVALTRAVHHCRIFVKVPKNLSANTTIFHFLERNPQDDLGKSSIDQHIANLLTPLIQDSSISLDFEVASEQIDQSKITKQGIATQALAIHPHPSPSNPYFLKTSYTTLSSLLKQEEEAAVSLLISEETTENNADIIYQQALIDDQQRIFQEYHTKIKAYQSFFRELKNARGAVLGHLLHLIFEKIDYQKTREDQLLPQIKNIIKLENQSLTETEQRKLCSAIIQVLTTPLGPICNDLMLSELSWMDRSNEMQFEIKIPDDQCISASHLNHLLSIDFENDSLFNANNHGRFALFPKEFKFTGLIKGVIDLCIKHPTQDRYFVIDFKSNLLNFFKDHPSASQIPEILSYHPAFLKEAMIDRLYFLQVLVYLLALHRLLKHSLANTYQPQIHLGGVLFLFLRGMVGLKSKLDETSVLGVFEYQPTLSFVEAIDLLFANPLGYEQKYMKAERKGERDE